MLSVGRFVQWIDLFIHFPRNKRYLYARYPCFRNAFAQKVFSGDLFGRNGHSRSSWDGLWSTHYYGRAVGRYSNLGDKQKQKISNRFWFLPKYGKLLGNWSPQAPSASLALTLKVDSVGSVWLLALNWKTRSVDRESNYFSTFHLNFDCFSP